MEGIGLNNLGMARIFQKSTVEQGLLLQTLEQFWQPQETKCSGIKADLCFNIREINKDITRQVF